MIERELISVDNPQVITSVLAFQLDHTDKGSIIPFNRKALHDLRTFITADKIIGLVPEFSLHFFDANGQRFNLLRDVTGATHISSNYRKFYTMSWELFTHCIEKMLHQVGLASSLTYTHYKKPTYTLPSGREVTMAVITGTEAILFCDGKHLAMRRYFFRKIGEEYFLKVNTHTAAFHLDLWKDDKAGWVREPTMVKDYNNFGSELNTIKITPEQDPIQIILRHNNEVQ